MVRMDDDGGLQLLKQEDGSLLTPNILHLKKPCFSFQKIDLETRDELSSKCYLSLYQYVNQMQKWNVLKTLS